jgi:hypothetical protein
MADEAAPDLILHGGRIHTLRSRFRALARDKDQYRNEFDRLIADVEARCRDILAEQGLEPGAGVSDERYPEAIWYAGQIIDRTAEIRDLRDHNPDLAIAAALVLGHLIGEAQAHLSHGEDAARGVKTMQSVKAGHEGVHGSPAAKRARWRAQLAAFEKYRAQGVNITESEWRAATECGVSKRTIHQARKRAQIK